MQSLSDVRVEVNNGVLDCGPLWVTKGALYHVGLKINEFQRLTADYFTVGLEGRNIFHQYCLIPTADRKQQPHLVFGTEHDHDMSWKFG